MTHEQAGPFDPGRPTLSIPSPAHHPQEGHMTTTTGADTIPTVADDWLIVTEALEAAGWTGADDNPLEILQKDGACWAISNDCYDSAVSKDGWNVDFPSDTPVSVVIAACLAAVGQAPARRILGGTEQADTMAAPAADRAAILREVSKDLRRTAEATFNPHYRSAYHAEATRYALLSDETAVWAQQPTCGHCGHPTEWHDKWEGCVGLNGIGGSGPATAPVPVAPSSRPRPPRARTRASPA
ncbi:hypothetical protein Sfulv_18340 [Streptomyces fulvorobeus]|uniref:Uncharacterized protein n=2 Tax=Streptomyces fulvorobeus TaxID=284028 RepID=A0A7J0C561_9ACTN|nr:hypothetical protein Sfulv_18340 [Streptomyces fulvorobeus]